MKPTRTLSVCLLSGMAALAMLSTAVAAPPGPARDKNVTVTVVNGEDVVNAHVSGSQQMPLRSQQMSLTSYGAAPSVGVHDEYQPDGVPLWTFHVHHAPRDGLNHVGAMVGTNPFTDKETSRVPVIIVPMIITTHTVATSLDTSTFMFSTANGDFTQNSGARQKDCLKAPNNVPATLVYQSPIFQNAPFSFGGVSMGNTQYIDAFQRANFYQALGGDPGDYHVLFSPVSIVRPIAIDVPANEGLSVPPSVFQAAFGFSTCATVQILDINWFDSYINGTLLPQLQAQDGLSAGTIPVFFLYNTNLAAPVTNLGACCILGYHSFAGEPKPSQLYSVAEIDVSGLFIPGIENTAVLAHELGELVDDPYGDNEVPPWGHTGQVGACQENLEDGDPLTGTAVTPVTMKNGFTYQLQELAFFSWFFGGQSLGVNGWYSNNGTFTTDAGPVCGS